MKQVGFALLLILSGCGYHSAGGESGEALATLSIPYITGDKEGRLNNALINAIASSSVFRYEQRTGSLILRTTIVSDNEERIGFRYDRNPHTGKLRDNVVGTENRRTLSAEFKLIDAYTEEIVFGPEVITAAEDYDYVDGNSIQDLVFKEGGASRTVLSFSLGQLDSVDGAHDDVDAALYQQLANRLVQRLKGLQIRENDAQDSASQEL